MSTLEVEHSYVPDQLVDQLAKGYDALSVEIKLLDEQRQELENRLSWAKQQVRLFYAFFATSTTLL
jgi:chaperonin cofactor prefoldin